VIKILTDGLSGRTNVATEIPLRQHVVQVRLRGTQPTMNEFAHVFAPPGSRRELATENGFGSIGWHTFRHSYRTFLGELKAALEVQEALMRQADISTTLKYGQSSMETQRTANRMVVREILIRRSQK
jgi:site-specific recombinase XerD